MKFRYLALGLIASFTLTAAANAAVVVLDFTGLGGDDQFERPADFYNGGLGSLGSGPGADYGVTFSADTFATCTLAYACDDPANDGMPRDILRFLDPRASLAPTPDPDAPSVINVANGFVQSVSMLYATRTVGSLRVWSGHNGTGTVLRAVELAACDEYPLPCLFTQVDIDFAGVGRSVEFVNVDFNLAGFDNIAFDIRNAVPEPSTWAIMIAGFGLAGGALRRRSGASPSPAGCGPGRAGRRSARCGR